MTHAHFVGIGGSGLSAIARLLNELGYQVSGSDQILSPLAAALKKDNIQVTIGHFKENVIGADFVVRSSAVQDDNPEVVAAHASGIPVYKRADFLGQLMAPPAKNGIAIAGTHGKTTTTAMIAWTLDQLGANPSFIIGGISKNFGVNARAGKGKEFVIEADEYDRMFLGLKPRYEVVTNIEHDHPDIYPTPSDFFAAFKDFSNLIPENGGLIFCAEDPGANKLSVEAARMGKRVIGYRIAEKNQTYPGETLLAKNLIPNQTGGFSFEVEVQMVDFPNTAADVQLILPGLHNVRNSLATLGITCLLGYPLESAALALSKFKGTGRRFEIKGEVDNIVVIDDYAHHPTEIRATIEAARVKFPSRRLWVVWQPHTYSRVQTLYQEFTTAFDGADQVIVSEIYAAREPYQNFSAIQVVSKLKHPSARFIPTVEKISEYLISNLKSGDVLVVMSAGDADQISRNILKSLKTNIANKKGQVQNGKK